MQKNDAPSRSALTPGDARTADVGAILLVAFAAVATIGGTITLAVVQPASYVTFCIISLGLAISGCLSLLPRRGADLSIFKAFVILFALFHFGLIPAYLATPDLRSYFAADFSWFLDNALVREAIIGSLLFLSGNLLAYVMTSSHTSRPSLAKVNLQTHMAATLILLLAIAVWLMFIIANGITNYIDYITTFQGNPALAGMIGTLHSTIAAAFFVGALAAPNPKRIIAIYGLWSLVAFWLGLRGEALFPLVLTLSVLAMTGRFHVRKSVALMITLVALTISSLVFVTRVGGSFADAAGAASPLRGVAELGGTLRPVYEVNSWLYRGDEYRLGGTYIAPFERAFLKIIPIAERVSAEEDLRLMNVLMMKRVGPYGFSIVAEAIINFGLVGAAVFGFLSGAAMISCSKNILHCQSWIFPTIAFGFFIHIRQDFVTAFGSAVGFAIVYLFIVNLGHILPSVKRPFRKGD